MSEFDGARVTVRLLTSRWPVEEAVATMNEPFGFGGMLLDPPSAVRTRPIVVAE